VPTQNRTKSREIDGLFFNELSDPNEMLWPANPQGRCDEMLGSQDARPDRSFGPREHDLNFYSVSKRLLVEGVGDGQELNRPSRDHNSFPAMLIEASGFQVRIDRRKRNESGRCEFSHLIEGNQDVKSSVTDASM
jgi:hypothetical protein